MNLKREGDFSFLLQTFTNYVKYGIIYIVPLLTFYNANMARRKTMYSTIFNTSHNIEELIQKACLEVNDGMPTYWSIQDKEEKILHRWYEDKSNGYDCNNSTIAFWYNGHLYVTRYTRVGARIIASVVSKVSMYVPFSNGEVPSNREDFNRWETIRRNSKFEHMNEYADDAAEYAKKIRLQEIPREILDKCFKVDTEEYLPLEGEGYAHPFMSFFDCTAEWYFGKYVIANGVINFVAHDGMTYFSRNPEILGILKEAGYTPGGEIMKVQMAHGERFQNPNVQREWMTA